MALNVDRIRFYLERISSANYHTFSGEVAQLIKHLDEEVKENKVYAKYELEKKEKWKDWPRSHSGYEHIWNFPSDYGEAKSLSYDLYTDMGRDQKQASNLPAKLMRLQGRAESIYKFNSTFLDYFQKALDDILNANPEITTDEVKDVEGNNVFIVHGHDEEMKKDVQLMLTRGMVNNMVLHERASKGRTVIDKLIEESSGSNFAICLLSPDDMTKDGDARARQNVILETGYFLGKLGKNRVVMLVREDVEIPSDMAGVIYEKYDGKGAWKMKVAKELQAVGIYVDIQNLIDTA